MANPPTLSDYAKHRALIDENIVKDNKLLFFGHSQGNLFVNAAYDYAKKEFSNSDNEHKHGNSISAADNPSFKSSNKVKAIHVAPASIIKNGPYTLANNRRCNWAWITGDLFKRKSKRSGNKR